MSKRFCGTIEVHYDANAESEEEFLRKVVVFKDGIDDLGGTLDKGEPVICSHFMDCQEVIQEKDDAWPSFVEKEKVERAGDMWKTLVMPHLKEMDVSESTRNSIFTGFLLAFGFPYHEVVPTAEQFKKRGLL